MSVEVKQSDREAAASVLPPFVRAEVLAGKHDTAGDCSATVQAFAAHRHQAEEAMRERCAKIFLDHPIADDFYYSEREEIAAAIRSMDGGVTDFLRMIRNVVLGIAFLPVMFVMGLIGGVRRIIKGR